MISKRTDKTNNLFSLDSNIEAEKTGIEKKSRRMYYIRFKLNMFQFHFSLKVIFRTVNRTAVSDAIF